MNEAKLIAQMAQLLLRVDPDVFTTGQNVVGFEGLELLDGLAHRVPVDFHDLATVNRSRRFGAIAGAVKYLMFHVVALLANEVEIRHSFSVEVLAKTPTELT